MKKMLLAVSVFCIQYTQAQTVVTFDDLTLATNTHWNGSDQSGGFTSGGVHFENTYSGYWAGGFIYSNTTDVTTGTYLNDFSAYAGTGANGSSNYAVNYGGNLDFGTEKVLTSIQLTNTTFAGLVMLNGNQFSKVFGSINGPDGNPDGTNGEDWFRLLIIGKDAQSAVTDTVIFYLADYRFANNTQDYIVNTWETVDLTPLGEVQFLEFELQSSDEGGFGINTPAYFALDNLVYGTASVKELSLLNQEVYPNPTTGKLTVKSATGTIKVFASSGELVLEKTTNGIQEIDLNNMKSGIYFVETSSSNGIARTRISKI
ncbi:DUF4465 domain-containing protein [Fluviicola taffensis]|uniref:Secretion system C-terminal sorting domain-containing protein n=1 Tax=Fluviicola taffensis (strain DSM 16823 / NCIMB 13979 / RW262) TaxID=755732 RepID=F2I9N3_FLUTR|nr:DUF4465 domain-containing protein [Fluviicola taffensis]AEA42026.1 hypothetical protein Fluta_0016 [Fluviicola taffensis DSM 16823]